MSSWHLRDARTGRSSSETLGAGPSRPPVADQTADAIQAPPPPLGRLLEEVRVQDLADSAKNLAASAVVKDSVLVSSYNWASGGGRVQEPTITVPGRPPRWTPLSRPIRLPDDNGNYGWGRSVSTRKVYRDQNAAGFPKHPMEPAILATLETAPDFLAEHSIDVIACGSTMGNLLRFVKGQDKMFRMLVQVVDDSVFLIRRENSPTELIPDIQGFGHSFPENYTTWDYDVRGSKSHQRMVSYRFGNLRFLVRFEGDGYLGQHPGGDKPVPNRRTENQVGNQTRSSISVHDLAQSMSGTGVSVGNEVKGDVIKIQRSGALVNQDLIFDLKTRSCKKRDQLEEMKGAELQRLWVSRVTKFILAFHNRGLFDDIRIMDVKDEIDEWESTNSDALAKLAALVHRIIALARAQPDGKIEVCRSEGCVLEIRRQVEGLGDVLSPETRDRWIGSSAGGARFGR
ncbi:hypothetical protein PpBr36_09101 [Pyricularia pennisetigena]|uniref:hypothetical protein n=1 Tax=Pyricularia pennisetigena TaxID=1578925 RepID=UPI0011525ECA|nr:hypothetical protein PpBr36_09101 [Pyricularia pennisetigena]TLS23907.1 hypothetical protein PpBr36_09101 [Pyricularia pennisetigena]